MVKLYMENMDMDIKDTIEKILFLMDRLRNELEAFYEMNDPKTSFDRLLTRKEASGMIGRTVQSLDRMVREGKLHKVYVNGVPRLRKSELLRHLGYDFDPKGQTSHNSIRRLLTAHGKKSIQASSDRR